jgi:hypothetical protein
MAINLPATHLRGNREGEQHQSQATHTTPSPKIPRGKHLGNQYNLLTHMRQKVVLP